MGHSTITITFDRYGHLMPGSEDGARALLNDYLDERTQTLSATPDLEVRSRPEAPRDASAVADVESSTVSRDLRAIVARAIGGPETPFYRRAWLYLPVTIH
jgi:hypothetical protein